MTDLAETESADDRLLEAAGQEAASRLLRAFDGGETNANTIERGSCLTVLREAVALSDLDASESA